MSMTSTTRPARTAFERKCARLASHHERQEAQRAIAFAALADESRELVAWGIRAGLIVPPNREDGRK